MLKRKLRVVLSVVAQKKWKLNSIDIKAAFLQGENIDRELYVLPPKEANTDKIWLLKRCTYRLFDASRQWYNTVKQVLLSLGFKMSKADQCLFYCQNNNELEAVNVDKFLGAENEQFLKYSISKIHETCADGKQCNTPFRYLGLGLKEGRNNIFLDQTHYIKLLHTINLEDENLGIHDTLQSTISKLIWISGQTRPDIISDNCHLASNLKNSTLADTKHLNKVISHLKQSNISLTFWYLGEISKLKLVIYADVAHGNLANGATQEDYLIFLVAENGKRILLNWQSKRIRRAVRSSLAAETLSLSDATNNGIYSSKVLSELLFNNTYCIPIEVVTDSKYLYDALHSKKNVLGKCLRIDTALLKEFIVNRSFTKIIMFQVKIISKCFNKKGNIIKGTS